MTAWEASTERRQEGAILYWTSAWFSLKIVFGPTRGVMIRVPKIARSSLKGSIPQAPGAHGAGRR